MKKFLLIAAFFILTMFIPSRATATPFAIPVFINEIHYDNVSTDTGEAIEIAGPAGTDLSGWSIVLYNGNGGATYGTLSLSGAIPDQCGGYGTVSVAAVGLQNGSPDGLALVNGSTVVQFLSYEGTFTAVGGPANGMTSTDIGVSEGGSDPAGWSLRLTGTGSNYEDFAWQPPAAASFGACNPGQTFTGGGDTPPSVSSTSPANNATNVALNANLTITFSENVTVTAPWFDLTCTSSGTHPATQSGGPLSFTLNPDFDFVNAETCTVIINKDQIADQDGTPDNMAADYIFAFNTPGAHDLIHTIQGSGTTSPLNGQTVTISGIVVGDYQSTTTSLGGYFVQEEDVDADADPATSEGVYVYANGFGPDVNVGDLVEVSGTVTEYGTTGTLTEIGNLTQVNVISTGNLLPTAVTITLPVNALTAWERYEGMRVTFPQPLYVTEHYQLGRYGQITLSGNARLSQPTNVVAPGSPALALQAANDLNRIILDDASSVQNPDPIIYPAPGLSASQTLRGGDTTTNLTGILDERFDFYRVQPTGTVTFTTANPRPTTATLPGGNLKIVSANVLNYFTTLDTGALICGPLANQGCRGANSAQELTRQRNKLLNALYALNADVFGLIEIENSASDAALSDIVSGLNSLAGAGTYAKINTGPIGGDAIKVALIYKTTTVTPIGVYKILDDSFNINYHADKNRPALAQTFSQTITGEKFTVVVNHFKSKGSACTGDPDMGDGQGNCNQTRTDAANVLVSWLATDPTNSGDPDFILLGDLNSYAKEDPITALQTGGFTNLIDHYLGTEAYSYVFDGQWGYLDYALANASLLPQTANTTEWHINADEPIVLDYNTEFKSAGQITSLYSSDPFRISDHDPVVVGLYSFDFSDLNGTYGVAWHTGGGTLRLGNNWDDSPNYGDNSDNLSDDGVTRSGTWLAGNNVSVNATTNGAGYLAAWFDWNHSGTFEAGEKVIGQTISGAGTHVFNLTLPAGFDPNATLVTRFRFYASEPTLLAPEGTETPTGAGAGGEVEDYNWTFSPTAVTLAHFAAHSLNWVSPLSLGLLLLLGSIILWRAFTRRAENSGNNLTPG